MLLQLLNSAADCVPYGAMNVTGITIAKSASEREAYILSMRDLPKEFS